MRFRVSVTETQRPPGYPETWGTGPLSWAEFRHRVRDSTWFNVLELAGMAFCVLVAAGFMFHWDQR